MNCSNKGIRDVAKAKYLLNSESATAEEKTELTDVVEHLAKPQKGTYQGSAVAASEKDRMLVHSETERGFRCDKRAGKKRCGEGEPESEAGKAQIKQRLMRRLKMQKL